MRLKHFLETMAALGGWRIAPIRCIRHGKDCPLTAVYFEKCGSRLNEHSARIAAYHLGIPYPEAIINAAMAIPDFLATTTTRMSRRCGSHF